jgi:hypothetical protein
MLALSRVIVVVLLMLVVLSGVWLWRRWVATPPPPVPAQPSATLTPTVEPTSTPLGPPPGYRLAGVAVGEPDSFAVLEAPNGTNTLYRRNAEVPGLGRLVRIEAERVVFETAEGQFELWLAPAATATPGPVQAPTRPRATPTRRLPLRSPAAGTARGSTP